MIEQEQIQEEVVVPNFFDGFEAYEEVVVRAYKGAGSSIPVFSVDTNPSGRESLRHTDYFRNVCEKFERIFYQKDHVFVCSVDGMGLELRVMNIKKESGKAFDRSGQTNSSVNQENGVRLSFHSPIVRDVVIIDYNSNVSDIQVVLSRQNPATAIMVVPVAVGAVFLFPLDSNGFIINQNGFPNHKLHYLHGESSLDAVPLAIRRITETNICSVPGRPKTLSLGVLHPSPGIYIYTFDLDDSEIFNKQPLLPSRGLSLGSCRHVQIAQSGIIGSILQKFIPNTGRKNDSDDNYFDEISYLGNDLIVGITRSGIARLFSCNAKAAQILAEITLPNVTGDFHYQIGKILFDPCSSNTPNSIKVVILFALVPTDPLSVILNDTLLNQSTLHLWQLTFKNPYFKENSSDLINFDQLIYNPQLFNNTSIVTGSTMSRKIFQDVTILGFNRNIRRNLFLSIYSHNLQVHTTKMLQLKALMEKNSSSSLEDSEHLFGTFGYNATPILTTSIWLVKQLVDDYAISRTTNLTCSSQYLLERIFVTGRFSPFTLYYTLKRMNGLANLGVRHHIFSVDLDSNARRSQVAKEELDPAFKILCQEFLTKLLHENEGTIKSGDILNLLKTLTVVELGIEDSNYQIFNVPSKDNCATFKISSGISGLRQTLAQDPVMKRSLSVGFGVLEEDIKHDNLTFGWTNEKLVILRQARNEEAAKIAVDLESFQNNIKILKEEYLKLRGLSQNYSEHKRFGEFCLGTIEDWHLAPEETKILTLLSMVRKYFSIEVVGGKRFEINPELYLKARVIQDIAAGHQINDWVEYLNQINSGILAQNCPETVYSYVSLYTRNQEIVETFLNSISNSCLSSLVAEKNPNLKSKNRESSRALKIPYVALKLASHFASKKIETRTFFLLAHGLHQVLIEKHTKLEVNELSRLVDLNVQGQLALSSLIQSNLSGQGNVKIYKSSKELRAVLEMTGDLTIATDVLVTYLNSFNIATIQFRNSNQIVDWAERTASQVIIDTLAISTGLDQDQTSLENVLKYLLLSDNETNNFWHIADFIHSQVPSLDYAKALYLASQKKYDEASRLIFKTSAAVNFEFYSDFQDQENLDSPSQSWIYLHNQNSAFGPSANVNNFFGSVYRNFSEKYGGLICLMAKSVCQLECLNLKIKQKYFGKMLQLLIEEDRCDEAYNTILAFPKSEERKAFYSDLIKLLNTSGKLDQLHRLFSNHSEISMLNDVLWKNVEELQVESETILINSSSPSLIILQPPIEKIRRMYNTIAYMPLKSHSPTSALQIVFEFSLFLRKIYCVYGSRLGLECKCFILEELKGNLSYCLALSEFSLDDEGNPSSSSRIFECKKYGKDSTDGKNSWLEKPKSADYINIDLEIAYVDRDMLEFEEGVTVHKNLLEKWIVQIDGLLMLNEFEKSTSFPGVHLKEDIHDNIVQAYVVLDRIEEAVDYVKYFTKSVSSLCHSLTSIACQHDERLVVSTDSYNQKNNNRIFRLLNLLLTDVPDKSNIAKLSVLDTYLCLHKESKVDTFHIDGKIHNLLLEECGLQYSKKLAEFDFIQTSMDVVLESIDLYRTRMNDVLAGSGSSYKYFDPLLLKKVRYLLDRSNAKVIQVIRLKCGPHKAQMFTQFFKKVSEKCRNLKS